MLPFGEVSKLNHSVMPVEVSKIAFGGGCHWCTEAVFQSIIGVEKVEQGYVASTTCNRDLSEAIIVHYNGKCVTLSTLIEIHLLTHNSKSDHSMRKKYRSAIYTFSKTQQNSVTDLLKGFQLKFHNKLITKVLPFSYFKPSREALKNYYFKNPEKPFCETYINPKLKLILQQFSEHVNSAKLSHLKA